KAGREIEAQLAAEHAARAGAGAIAAIDAVIENIAQQAEISDVGLARRGAGLGDRFGAHFRANMGWLGALSYRSRPKRAARRAGTQSKAHEMLRWVPDRSPAFAGHASGKRS